jgi:hypothetical protein
VSYTRTFDPDRVHTELGPIQQWLRTCGINPAIVPSNATIVFHRRRMTIELYRRGRHGLLLNEARTDAIRDRRAYRTRRRPPHLASLGPACRRQAQPTSRKGHTA